jgi:LDH2 family malate/lactate/ureidoglycolate dehydrogenase
MVDFTEVGNSELGAFVTACFEKSGVSKADSRITADVLIESDRRGIASHGVARLRRYIEGLRNGVMVPNAVHEVVKETPTTLLISGNGGLGQPVSYKTMKLVIEKAAKHNVAVAAVRNSNHYGIAGYYSMMALKENLLGISMTNTSPLVVPTFGRNALLGTNPISLAAPSGREQPFVLDMATSTTPQGKLEEYNRRGKTIPEGWATDAQGLTSTDPALVLKNLKTRAGGGLLPLGGASEESGGHKGYGLAMIVEILTGVLSAGAFGPDVARSPNAPANVCHFFAAINVAAFIPLDQFAAQLDGLIRTVRDSAKAPGQDRIYIHGEKEFIAADRQKNRVGLLNKVVDDIKDVGATLGVKAGF